MSKTSSPIVLPTRPSARRAFPVTPAQGRAVGDLTAEPIARNASPSPTLSPSPGLTARLVEARGGNGKVQGTQSSPCHIKTPGSATPSPLKRKRIPNDDGRSDRVIASVEGFDAAEPRLIYEDTRFGEATPVINLVDDSDNEDEQGNDDELIDVEVVRRRQKQTRSLPRFVAPLRRHINTIHCHGLEIRVDYCVEFGDGTFMKVKSITSDSENRHILTGNVFVRSRTHGQHMPARRDGMEWKRDEKSNERDTRLPSYFKGRQILNELVQKVRTVVGEEKSDHGLWQRFANDVVRIRELRITNQDYNDTNCVLEGQFQGSLNRMQKEGVLFSRWKDITLHAQNGKWQAQSLERHSYHEADPEWRTNDDDMQLEWRGVLSHIDKDTDITFIDSFCGAGGMSSGAEQAGLKVYIAFDKDPNKILTHNSNFPDCKSIAIGVAEFIEKARRRRWNCDVLHLSPPCQPFSSANTRPNEQKNEINSTPILACGDVIKVLRPRIVTVEEAPGIVSRHHAWFYALLHQFTDLGLSIRWSELRTAEFGVLQLRRRFILIAAAPGEVLPPFPNPTHKEGSVTIKSVLVDLHEINKIQPLKQHDKKPFPTPKASYNPKVLAKTITCGASENYHPNGRRPFTIRELASLQTFQFGHKFTEFMYNNEGEPRKPVTLGEHRQQIGNAVPPNLGKAVLAEVVKSLRRSDKARIDRLRGRTGVVYQVRRNRNIIELD